MSKKRRARSPGQGSPPGTASGRGSVDPLATSPRERKPSARSLRAAARERSERLRRVRNIAAVAFGVAILGGVIGLAVSSAHSSTAGDSTSAQAFVLPRLGGPGKVRLAGYRGTPVVVNFFASWCTQCAGELPVFAQDARNLRSKVDFIEVDALETGDGLSFANRFDLPSSVTAVASDVGGSQGSGLYQALGGNGSMPMTAFYSRSGALVTTHLGAFDATTLSGQLEQLYGISGA